MPYVALEFDHKIAQPAIQWIVVKCSGVGEKCGGPIALSPRHDVAYFMDPVTASRDAKLFADYKNTALIVNDILQAIEERRQPMRHYAYQWDHQIFSSTLKWGVLEWSGDETQKSSRIDVAYFVDLDSAEPDSKVFAFLRDQNG
ncbi:hypothetical protein M2366_000595 [Aeromonas sp. BIGb0405]|uniref:hypothetical protein n=1 Tax=unclassified Aeromonas TaxID=257493 RepID=UPI00216A1F57|nr:MULTISPECIES: hypothetical protein [unclassified Aeromonas]MCS3454556.1 hypothetical protein [Aeromonas sp. BIGb0405]MCS3459485.1 hypothetical protein [Aeromonas sp. BIGb0445]